MIRAICKVGLLGALCLLTTVSALADDLWSRIQKNGELRVGVKIDYPPFGMLDSNGDNIGFEVDMARRLANDLGVRLTLYAVTGSNRLHKLEEGTIDLLIATLGNTPARREQATLIEPGYYASGVGLMTTSERHPGAWFDLRGQEICAVQGSYFNQTVAQQQLLSLQIYSSAREAKQALHDGRCAGWLFDQPAIDWALSQEDGSSYASTVPPLLNVSWAMALPRVERGGRLHRWLQNQMGQWHQEGYLLKLEQRWHLRPTAYLADMHQRWSHSSSGSPPCGSQNQGDWPSECLTGLQSGDVDLLHPQTLQWWLSGLLHTLGLLLACVMISLLMGLALWRWLMAQSARMQWASRMILGGLRLTPPLLVMGLFFYGIGGWLKLHIGWQPSGTLIATLCLSAYAGASVFLALDQTRQHLATSGLEPPGHQVIALAWPAIKGVLVNVSKATMMASALAVPELLSVSTSLMAETGQVHGVMNLMLVTYVALGLIIMGLLDHLEQRWRLRSKD